METNQIPPAMTTETAKLWTNKEVAELMVDASDNQLNYEQTLEMLEVKRPSYTPKPQGEGEETNPVMIEVRLSGIQNLHKEIAALKLSHGKLVDALKEILYSDECSHIDVAESIAREALSSFTDKNTKA